MQPDACLMFHGARISFFFGSRGRRFGNGIVSDPWVERFALQFFSPSQPGSPLSLRCSRIFCRIMNYACDEEHDRPWDLSHYGLLSITRWQIGRQASVRCRSEKSQECYYLLPRRMVGRLSFRPLSKTQRMWEDMYLLSIFNDTSEKWG